MKRRETKGKAFFSEKKIFPEELLKKGWESAIITKIYINSL